MCRITALPGILFLLAACAGPQRFVQPGPLILSERDNSPRLFVGHSQSGDIVVAASHYDAMAGLATTDTDLGLAPRSGNRSGRMLCAREMPTGSHVPRWFCRYQDDIEQARLETQNTLVAPAFSPSRRLGSPAGVPTSGGGRILSN
jgi:hypothetical protein